MPSIYVANDDYQNFAADQWAQQAQGKIADQWAGQAAGNVPQMVSDAQDRANASAQAQADAQAAQQQQDATNQAAQAGYAQAAQEAQQQQAAQDWSTQAYSQAATHASGVAPQPITPPADPPSALPSASAGNFVAVAYQAAQKYGLDPETFVRQIQQESNFNPSAKSGAGAIGIAQFMPDTARGLGIDPTDPLASLDGAAKLMAGYVKKYGGDMAKALAAYNAGPGNVDKFGGVPPFAETQKYVSNILGNAGQSGQQLLQNAGQTAASVTQGAQNVLQAPVQSAQDILAKAQPFLGQAYAWGGKSPQQGFDCSGLAGYLTTGQPESTTTLYGKSTTVGADQAQPGDLVFWNMNSQDPHMQHVAVYLGNGQIVQSGGNQDKVNVGSVNQQIGSAPEFRRVASSAGQGAPAQANAPAGAPPPNVMPQQRTASLNDYIQQYQAQNGTMPTDQEVGDFVMGQMVPGGAPPPPPPPGPPGGGDQGQNQQQSPFDTIGGILGSVANTAGGALSAVGQGIGQVGSALGQAAQTAPAEGGGYGAAGPLQPGEAQSAITNPLQSVFGTPDQPSGLTQAVGAGSANPLLPSNLLDTGAQAIGQGVQSVVSGDATHALGSYLQQQAPNAPLGPMVPPIAQNVALSAAGGFLQQPTVMQQLSAGPELEQKYGMGLQIGADGQATYVPVDPSKMTPEDRQAYANSTLAVGGLAGPLELEGGAAKAVAAAVGQVAPKVVLPGNLPPLQPLERTPIGEGGLGTPIYNDTAGTPEAVTAQTLRSAAASSSDGIAHLSSDEMGQLPGMASTQAEPMKQGPNKGQPGPLFGHPPSLDDTRAAVDNGIPQARWYTEFAQNVANTVGQVNIPEFAALFGITSARNKVNVNLAQSLGLMRMARDFQASGTEFTLPNMRAWMDIEQNPENAILHQDGEPGKWAITDDKLKKIADLYTTGTVTMETNAKTASYAQNIISALRNQFDPNSTMDTWMNQLFNYSNTNKAASEDSAYRAMRAVTDHLAGELGIVPHQAQAAAWFSIKAVKDRAGAKGAPQVLKDAVEDYTKGGTTTLGDLIRLGKQYGAYDAPEGTWADVANQPMVAKELGTLTPESLAREAPGPAAAAQMVYPGGNEKVAFPVNPADTAVRRATAEGQAPSVSIPQNVLDQLGYDPQSNQFKAFNSIPHYVDLQPNAANVLLPGGNIDTAAYVGSIVNKAAGSDGMDVHMFTPEGGQTAGYKVSNIDGSSLDGTQAQVIRDALDAHDVSYSTSPDGTIVRIHAPTDPSVQPDFEARVASAIGPMPNIEINPIPGVATHVAADQFDPIIQGLAGRYGGADRSGLQAGSVGVGGTGAAEGVAGNANQAGPPAQAAGLSPPQDVGAAQSGPAQAVAANRFYHGTGSAFASPDAQRFDPDSLYGPGYYLTDNPEVAGGVVMQGGEPRQNVIDAATRQGRTDLLEQGVRPYTPGEIVAPGYAQQRQAMPPMPYEEQDLTEALQNAQQEAARARAQGNEGLAKAQDDAAAIYQQQLTELRNPVGPNVRAVDVPQDLKLFNTEGSVPPDLQDAWRQYMGPGGPSIYGRETGDEFYQGLVDELGSNVEANRWLEERGYQGIQYNGGQRIPMTGADGNPIQHTAVNIFPSATSQLRNAVSGTQGGQINPSFATAVGGAAAGGYAGYNSDPNAPPEERVARAAVGALAGAGLGYAAASAARSGINPMELIQAERVGSLAGGVQTISHIMFNAPLQAAWKVVADAPLTLKSPETIPLEFFGAWKGLSSWAQSALGQLAQPGHLAQQAGGGIAGQALETGLLGLVKTHPVLQDFAQQVGSSMEMWRLAGEEASRSSMRFSPQWWNDVNKIVASPSADMAQQAQRVGQTFGLRGDMGTMGTKLGQFLQDNPLGRFLNPFFNIGYHVATEGIERSPLGALGTAYDVARAPFGSGPYAAAAPAGQQLMPGVSRFNWQGTAAVDPLGTRIRNNMLGLGAAVWAFDQAAQGNITGNGPSDPNIRNELMSTGWQPDSIRVGGRYFPLHVLGPLGWPLGEAANLYEATHVGPEERGGVGFAKPGATPQDQLGDYAARMGQYFGNETFMRGIGQLTQALGSSRDASRTAEQEISSVLGSLVPQGALLANVASSMDTNTRQIQSGNVQQALENRLPGLRQQLPVKISPTGLPEPNPSAGAGILLPRSSVQQNDPVAQMLLHVGMSPPSAPNTIRAGSQQVTLTPDEKYQYQTLRGAMLQQMMVPLTQNKQFLAAPPIAQRKALETVMAHADSIAQKQLLGQIAQTGSLPTRIGPTARQTPPQSFAPPLSLADITPDATIGMQPQQQQLPITSDLATLSPQLQEQLGAGR